MMCITYNAYGQVLYRHLYSDNVVSTTDCLNYVHELTALDATICGWQILQEWVWACNPHIDGPFCNYHLQIQVVLPIVNEMIVAFYHRVHYLSHEIQLSRNATGMQHELMHNLVQFLICNGDYGFTSNML
jgi:hypothetical protein